MSHSKERNEETMQAKRIIGEKELESAFHIRKVVFVEEQGVPLEDEFDAFDAHADHILVYDSNNPVATGRLRIVEGMAKLERICVLSSHRKCGVGKIVVQTLEKIAKEKGISAAKLHGQTQAVHFYEKLGYKTASDEFMEDGIPHVLMVKQL